MEGRHGGERSLIPQNVDPSARSEGSAGRQGVHTHVAAKDT